MKYYSEVTSKLYNTEEQLAIAEKNVKKMQEIKEKAEKEKKEARAARAKEVEEAFKAAKEAQVKANKLLSAFTKDYGYFHMSYSKNDKANEEDYNLFDILFGGLF